MLFNFVKSLLKTSDINRIHLNTKGKTMEKKNVNKKVTLSVIAIFAVAAIVAGCFAIPSVRNFVLGEWTITVQPTCETEGEQQRINCFNMTKTKPVAPLGHDFKITVVDPDCINDGYSTYDCKRCDELYDADFVHANGHDFSEWEVLRVATCTNNGLKKQTCKTCEKTNAQTIHSVGHTYKPSAEELDNTTDVKYICSACNDTIIQGADEQIPVNIGDNLLFDVALDFSFDIVTSENEEYIRENLSIIIEALEDTEYEDLEIAIQQYNLKYKGNNVWTVSPISDYKYLTTYKARLSGNISFADFENDNLIFRTIVDENHENVCEYNDDIVFLAKLEANSPGYYPYTISPSENGEFLYLYVNKYEDLHIGDIICVGDVDSVEELYTVEDYTFGKIKNIQPLQDGKWLVVLEAPELDEVFSELDIMHSDDIIISEDALDEEAIGEAMVDALYEDEDFHKFLASVNLAANSYASENGYDTASIKNISSFLDNLSLTPEVRINDAGNGIIGKIYGELKIPLKDSNKRDLGDIKVSFTVDVDLSFDVPTPHVTRKWYEIIPSYIDISLTQTSVFGFEFSVEIDIDYTLQNDAYLQHKTSGKIHRRGCTRLTTNADPKNFEGISVTKAEKLIKENASLECTLCKPAKGFISDILVLNTDTKTIHMYNCTYAQNLSAKNRQTSTEKETYWLNKGYSCCDHCHPENRKELDFSGKMLDSLNYTDWAQTVTDIAQYAKDAGVSEEVSKEKVLVPIPIDILCIRFRIDITFNFSFELEASATYEYAVKNVSKTSFTYASGGVNFHFAQLENTVTKNEFTLIGQAKVKAGFGVNAKITITGLDNWLYAQIGTDVGAYAELSGILHQDFLSDEDYSAAYLELGLYLNVDWEYKVPLLPKGSGTIYSNEWPLFMLGYEKAYYAFDTRLDEILVNNSYYYGYLLKAKYFDLTDMKSLAELLNVNGEPGKYSVNVSLKDGKYFEVKDGCVVEKGKTPCNATDTLVISVISTTPSWTTYNVNKAVYYLNDYEVTVLPAVKNHNYVSGICANCSLKAADDENHTCTTVERTIKEPTCTRTGTKQLYCSTCDRVISTQVIQKLNHEFGEWKVEIEPTEESYGKQYRNCTTCGYKESTTIPKLDHTHKYAVSWYSNETDHWKECKCGNKSDIASHTFGNWTTITEATEQAAGSKMHSCTVCGYEETAAIPMLEHTHKYSGDWSNNETDHWKECKCGNKSDIASHNYGDWTTTKAATEEAEGSKYHICKTCGYKETVTIPVLSHTHSFGDWKNNATSHWKECRCGEKSEFTSHTYGDWTTTKKATCTSTGTKKHTCTVCGYSETETIPKAEHTYGDWQSNATSHWKECKCRAVSESENHTYTSVVTSPTDIEQGYTTHTCNKCGYSYIDAYVDPTGNYSWGLEYELVYERNGAFGGGGLVVLPVSKIKGVMITGIGTCKDSDIKIPPVIDGYTVIEIDDDAFEDCANINSVIIPDGVTTIGNYAFSDCSGLTNITIPNSVTSIGKYAFEGCSGLTSVTISNGVAVIGEYMFAECTGLTNITIPDSVTAIGKYAFYGCTNLVNVTIGDGVTEIGGFAFSECTSLTNIIISDSVERIGVYVFSDCGNLESVIIGDSVEGIGYDFDNCVKDHHIYGFTVFDGCYNLTSVTFKDPSGWRAVSDAPMLFPDGEIVWVVTEIPIAETSFDLSDHETAADFLSKDDLYGIFDNIAIGLGEEPRRDRYICLEKYPE